jgi:chromosome partitioning protein
MKPPVVVMAMQKGGSGKTTISRELGLACGVLGLRVLLADLDAQANLTGSVLDLGDHAPGCGVFEALTEGRFHTFTVNPRVEILGADKRLSSLEKQLVGEVDAYTRLRDVFSDDNLQAYDLVICDTPPSLGVLTLNALAASDQVVVVMNPRLYTLQGANHLFDSVAKVKKSLNPGLGILGVVVNSFDPGPVIVRQIRNDIEEAFGGLVFDTAVSKSVRIEEAIASFKGVTELPGMLGTKSALEIHRLAGEFLDRLGLEHKPVPSLRQKAEAELVKPACPVEA